MSVEDGGNEVHPHISSRTWILDGRACLHEPGARLVRLKGVSLSNMFESTLFP